MSAIDSSLAAASSVQTAAAIKALKLADQQQNVAAELVEAAATQAQELAAHPEQGLQVDLRG